jgi:hypothetical protein
MLSSLGWTLLSQDALRRAETQLRNEVEGVRDEIGFLSLHQAYADRFFPGTSVLHTRLRYALFVPWIYQQLADQVGRQWNASTLEKRELELTRRLKEAGETGVIGIRNYPSPTAQPPSMTYWSALGTWHILRPTHNGLLPSRQTIHRTIARRPTHERLHDDDKQLLIEEEPLFYSIPDPPAAWNDSSKRLDFRLEAPERVFFRKCFLSITRPQSKDDPCLLSRLVEQQVEISDRVELWSSQVRAAADQADLNALIRARQAAALSAIGRGLYAALVEEIRQRHDGIPTETIHREELEVLKGRFSKEALALNVDDISIDAPSVPDDIINVLKTTQSWLSKGQQNLESIHETYAIAECCRKGHRARLAKTIAGRELRAEWLADKHPRGTPLHYRWSNVRQLLMDFQGTS